MSGLVEDHLYKKVAWRLTRFLLSCYTFTIINRFNIGFAKVQLL